MASDGIKKLPNGKYRIRPRDQFWGPRKGTGNGHFRSPHGVALDQSGNVFVADSGNNRVQKFECPTSPSGAFLDAGTRL